MSSITSVKLEKDKLFFLDLAIENLLNKREKKWGYFNIDLINANECRLRIWNDSLRLKFPKTKDSFLYEVFWGNELKPSLYTRKKRLSDDKNKIIVTVYYKQESSSAKNISCTRIVNQKLAVAIAQSIPGEIGQNTGSMILDAVGRIKIITEVSPIF